jgi:hypothetical protein
MKTYGGNGEIAPSFLTSAQDGQLHAPSALLPGKKAHGTHWIGGWVGPREGWDAVEYRKIFPLLGIEHRPSIPLLYRLLCTAPWEMFWDDANCDALVGRGHSYTTLWLCVGTDRQDHENFLTLLKHNKHRYNAWDMHQSLRTKAPPSGNTWQSRQYVSNSLQCVFLHSSPSKALCLVHVPFALTPK